MLLFKCIPVQLTLSLIVGIVAGFYIEVAPQFSFLGLLALLLVWYGVYKKLSYTGFPYFELGTLLVTVLLGIFVVRVALSQNLSSHYTHSNPTSEQLWQLTIDEVLKPNSYAQRYVAHVKAVGEQESTGKILLSLRPNTADTGLQVDDEVVVVAAAKEITPPLQPYQFNYRDYLKKQGIYHQIRTHAQAIHLLKNPSRTLKGRASHFREHLISRLKQENFGGDELAVIQALLLGKRDDISEHTYSAYKDAGAVHILAVSGLHVGILLLLLQWVFSPLDRLRKGKILKFLMVVGLLWAYAFVAGLSPSIVRAVTMFSFVAYATYINRPTNTFTIIALSVFFILLINPLFLFQVGFQMSYAAVFAIVWIYPKLQHFWSPRNVFLRKGWQLLSVSIAAQLGVLPLGLFYFHQFPALFFVANLLVVPFLGIILGMGIGVSVLSLLGILPSFMVAGYTILIKTMNAVVGWVAQQESFIFRDIPFDGLQLVLGYFTIVAMVVFFSQPKWKNTLAFAIGILALQGWAIGNLWQQHRGETLFLAHIPQNTVLVHQTGTRVTLYAEDATRLNHLPTVLKTTARIQSVALQPLPRGYRIGEQHLYVMDRRGRYPVQKNLDFLLLTQSPKINLKRLLDSLTPKRVVVDGSNYKSYSVQWKKTCAAKGIPFYNTAERGAFYFKRKE